MHHRSKAPALKNHKTASTPTFTFHISVDQLYVDALDNMT